MGAPEALIVGFSILLSLIPFVLTVYIAVSVFKMKTTVDSIDRRLAWIEQQRPPAQDGL